ncbi:proline dehydrogenase family protein [candidate division KSB1 bacterium]
MFDKLSRALMLSVAENETVRRLTTKYGMATPDSFARRFIAGENIDEGIEATKKLNEGGITATLDLLGENVTKVEESHAAKDVFLNILDKIAAEKVDSNISMKLTQLGLDLGNDVCIENVHGVIERAAKYNNFVRVDMEGSDYTQRTIDVFKHLYDKFPEHTGIVLQSYLYRTEFDVRDMNNLGARVRLCKGAYREPEIVAFQNKKMVDLNYIRCAELLLTEGNYPGIATHDENIINWVKEFTEKEGISKDKYEFQMLFGIRRDLQRQLVTEGYNIRIYVPFGTEWFPYFSRRLGERIGNVMFILRNLYREAGDGKDVI